MNLFENLQMMKESDESKYIIHYIDINDNVSKDDVIANSEKDARLKIKQKLGTNCRRIITVIKS